jgi:predicted CXXCH cytochrome family protein
VLARCRQAGGAGRLRLFSVWFVILLAMPSALTAAQDGSGTLQIAQATPADSASAENVRKSNGECLTCHSPTALANPPRADLDLAKLKRYLVDAELFNSSNHGGVECKTCHGPGFVAFPHKDNARQQISQCSECHAQKVLRIETQFDKSVHATQLPGKFTCTTCHDPHKFRAARNLGDPRRIVAQDNRMCLDCHQFDRPYHALAPDKERPDLERAHDWLPNIQLHWKDVRCVECHTPVSTVKTLALSHEILLRSDAGKDCVACHSRESTLRTRLYRHLVESEQETAGFLNSAILRHAYVIGATRNTYLDVAGGLLIAGTVGAVTGHGLVRFVAGIWRRRRRNG